MKRKRNFTVLIEHDETGYYVATVPSLQGCHTQAKSLDTLMKRVREVIELCRVPQVRFLNLGLGFYLSALEHTNGLRTMRWPLIRWPSCRSSEQRMEQPASSAAAMTRAS